MTPGRKRASSHRRAIRVVVALVGCALTVTGAGAQAAPEARHGVAFVPDDHWSLESARRLHALGLARPGYDPARRAQTQYEVAVVLRQAVAMLDSSGLGARTREALARDVAGDIERFDREFGATSGGLDERLSGSGLRAGYRSHSGRTRTGWGYEVGHFTGAEWRPAVLEPSESGGFARADLQAREGSWLAVRAAGLIEVLNRGTQARAAEAYVVAGTGPLAVWAGRRTTGYRPGATGGIVLSGVALDGLGVQTRRPVLLPWLFSALGPVSAEVSLSRRDRPHSFDDVLLMASRGTIEPHRRFTLGVTRAVEFGGEGNYEPDLFAILSVLIGKHAGQGSEFDNHVVAVDASWRLPTERWVPLRAYIDWGFEDSAGAWKDVPGILAGVEVPAIPGLEWLGLAVERTSFADECCGNPIWYRSLYFQDGWTDEAAPLGHPLGGEGTEWALIGRANRGVGEWQAAGQLFRRDRGRESLYEPARVGPSLGGGMRVDWTILGQAGIFADVSVEDGEGWRETAVRLGLRMTH